MSDFVHEGTYYNYADQFVMAPKAARIGDTTRHCQIMASSDPAEQKPSDAPCLNSTKISRSGTASPSFVRHTGANSARNRGFLRSHVETDNKNLAKASPYRLI